MADHMDLSSAAGIDERPDIVDQFGYPILPTAPRTRSRGVAALVGSQAAVTAHDEPRNYLVPRGIRLRVAMEEHNHRPVSRTAVKHVEDEISPSKLLHQSRW
ncbi:hypothetical protein MPRG_43090 [Mycobacterium paragordonae]|uniref:Uncharacterized protein n=1 Tax=Mycobacterium paragordonae TaxID=1389713 RepID=A0ABQ1CAE4_9MYCO|nr:hypothetical protein MPRG_43090 [Mycobacterium paragordonae]